MRKLTSLSYWFSDKNKSYKDFLKLPNWNRENLIQETKDFRNFEKAPVLTAHIFSLEFLEIFVQDLEVFSKFSGLWITTPNPKIQTTLYERLRFLNAEVDVRLTPNVGRNFAPLLVEFSEKLRKTSSFIHIHSKETRHAPRVGSKWLNRNLKLFLSTEGITSLSKIQHDPTIGLIYSDASDFLRGINYRWGRSREAVDKLILENPALSHIRTSGPIYFPAGGMFWAKTKSLNKLFDVNWKYEMFPKELQQIDGTLHHGIERLVGELALAEGYDHAIYTKKLEGFVRVRGIY